MADRLLVESPIGENSALSFKTGAGAGYFDIDYADVTEDTTMYEFAQKCVAAEEEGRKLGATDGGWTVALTPAIAETSTDDVPAPVFGLTQRHVGWESATMSGTAQEFDIDMFRYTMLGATKSEDGGTEFRVLPGLPPRIEFSLVCGLRNGDLFVYRLTGIIPTEGLSVTTVSANAGTFAISLSGSLTSIDEMRRGVAPIRIYQFGPDGQRTITPVQAGRMSASDFINPFAAEIDAALLSVSKAQAEFNRLNAAGNAAFASHVADKAKQALQADAPAYATKQSGRSAPKSNPAPNAPNE